MKSVALSILIASMVVTALLFISGCEQLDMATDHGSGSMNPTEHANGMSGGGMSGMHNGGEMPKDHDKENCRDTTHMQDAPSDSLQHEGGH